MIKRHLCKVCNADVNQTVVDGVHRCSCYPQFDPICGAEVSLAPSSDALRSSMVQLALPVSAVLVTGMSFS